MKNIYIIGGTMGVGKTAVCQALKKMLPASVFLDGDWCWDMHPFQVNDETKNMVMENITFLLNQFIHCSAYENIIFCWVMHEQSIVDAIVEQLDTENCNVQTISLVCNESTLRKRLQNDIDHNIRTADVIERSIARMPHYSKLNTIKIDTTEKTILQICRELIRL